MRDLLEFLDIAIGVIVWACIFVVWLGAVGLIVLLELEKLGIVQ